MRYTLAFLVLLLPPQFVSANELWKEVGLWTIYINKDDATRCFASRTLEDSSEVQIGTEPTLDGGFFAIYNSSWTHIEDGSAGTVEFDFGRSRFGGEATGKIEDGVPGGYAFFNNPAFVQEFARSQTVTIKGNNGTEFELDLTGTSRAVRGVLACQDAQPTGNSDD